MSTDKRIRSMSFSSEKAVVQRWFGGEILDHSPKSVRMDFIKSGRAPFLLYHDQRQQIGVISNASIGNDKIGRGKVRFGRTGAASDALQNVDDEIMTNTSVGYRVHEMILDSSKNGEDVYRVTDWEPYEVSLVGVPADPLVGMGRAEESQPLQTRGNSSVNNPAKPAVRKEPSMADENASAGENADNVTDQTRDVETRIEAGRQAIDQNLAVETEKKRQTAIRNLAKANSIGDDTVQAWISRGASLDVVADDILKIHQERGKASPRSISAVGISEREAGQYSLCRAILAARDNDWRKAGFELECHRSIADKTDRPQQNHCFYVPLEVQRRQSQVNYAQLIERHPMLQGRDLTVGSFGAGGALVQTSVMGFDELLRNLSFAFRMGATRLTGLRDNITIPRQSAAATAEWLTSESGAATESQPTFVQLAMTPKTVSAYTELSRKLLLQSSIDVEGLVNADLAAVAALAVDVAVISGSGTSGQPLGIDNVTGVGTVSGSSLGLAGILETQTDLATANVMPMRGGYVTTPAVAALMIAEVAYANTASPLWVGNVWNGTMMGFPAMSTNQVASATMYFGDWAKCVVGEWGVLEIDTNPYANFGAGIIGVRAMYSVDVGIRYPAAFTIASSIT